MPQSDEAGTWSAAVYQAVQEVPYGKVTTYGHIAKLVGNGSNTRLLICLHC
jgi:methylated-DNA-protein-cysteine methyltransferase-like protein